tara:strand:- start:1050 stop:1427 length:378 start_codon:yes stop_codon:yes gene_type:complete
MLWQLKKLSTNEALNDAGGLPENWGTIFGLSGLETTQLNDLSWLGGDYQDMGWFEVEGDLPATTTPEELAWEIAKQRLEESDWSMLPDVPMTSGEKSQWIEYRRQLREVRLHPDFPNMAWPVSPE